MSESLHLCFIENGYPHPHGGGGAGTYVQLVGRELVQRGHQVSVVSSWCPECGLQTMDEGVTIYRPKQDGSMHWYLGKVPGLRVGSLALRRLERGWRLYRFIEDLHAKDPIDVIEFTEGGDFWHAWRAPFPYLVHLHGSRYTCRHMSGRPVGAADWWHRWLELLFIQRAEWVVSPSQTLMDIVEAESGKPFNHSAVIPYPLDPRLLERPSASDVEKKGKIVLFAARNDPVKGADVLLEAVPQVRRAVPEVRFWMFGYQTDAETRIPEGVRCFDFVPKEELLQYYHQADLCVIPSRWDNSPNTVYEAMAAGKAVVASRVGGIPELVEDGETGLVVPPKKPQVLAHAIISMLTDQACRIRMGKLGRQRIQHFADLETNVDQRLCIYQQIVEEFREGVG